MIRVYRVPETWVSQPTRSRKDFLFKIYSMCMVRSTSKIIIKYDKNIVSNEEDKSTQKVIPEQFRKLNFKVPITK